MVITDKITEITAIRFNKTHFHGDSQNRVMFLNASVNKNGSSRTVLIDH